MNRKCLDVALGQLSAVLVAAFAAGCASDDDGSPNAGGSANAGGEAGEQGTSGQTGGAGKGGGGKSGEGATGGGGTNSQSGSGGGAGSAGKGGPTPIDPVLEPGSCGLENPAFCEKFDTPKPGGRGGDLDEAAWSYARYGHPAGQTFFLRGPFSTNDSQEYPATFCGEPFTNLLPGSDAKFCQGTGVDGSPSSQFNEVLDDEGDFGFNSFRIRQPFDFTDRTGTIVLDVDAKVNPLNQGHGWWIEVWITEDPGPMPYHEAPTVSAFPRSGVGFAFQFGGDCPEPSSASDSAPWQNSLESVTVTRDYEILHSLQFWEFVDHGRCFKVADTVLNHLEFRISQDKAEFYASDFDDPESFKLRSSVEGLDLAFTRGYVHFQHAAYNAPKDGNVTAAQTFRWDNIGFDGPTYPTPRAYEVPDNELEHEGRITTGYDLSSGEAQRFTLEAVDTEDAVGASLNFSLFAAVGQTLQYRLNDGEWHDFEVRGPASRTGTGKRTFSIPVSLDELTDGENAVEFKIADVAEFEMIGNIDLTIEVQP
jgi:hypothetical protein